MHPERAYMALIKTNSDPTLLFDSHVERLCSSDLSMMSGKLVRCAVESTEALAERTLLLRD